MRYIYFLSLIVLLACTGNGKGALKREVKLKQEAVAIAEKYASGQLTDKSRITDRIGVIILGNDQKRYIIEPLKVFTGLIDDDDEPDAVVTLTSYRGNYIDMIEHLILIKEEGKLLMIRSVESDMKVLTIKNRIITAKVPTHSRNSPLYNCEACQEIKNYRYINGNLEEIK